MATKSSSIQIYRGESRKLMAIVGATKTLYYDACFAVLKVGHLRTGEEFVHLDVGDKYFIVNAARASAFADPVVKCQVAHVLPEYPHDLIEAASDIGNLVRTSAGIEVCAGTDNEHRRFVLISLANPKRHLLVREPIGIDQTLERDMEHVHGGTRE
jgi:hypothetical protein